jgi:septum site-determining protein MinC
MAAASRRKSRENSGVALPKARKTKPMRKNAAGSGADLGALTRRELVSLVNQLRSKCAEVHASSTSAAASSQVDSAEPAPTSLVIDGSVRSGQVIEFLAGDVTVIGSVGSAAEIVAGGSIHVYGTLRGRAIAGMNGDRGARIMCRNLQAELLSIDGLYRVADNFEAGTLGRPIHARLDGARMVLSSLE